VKVRGARREKGLLRNAAILRKLPGPAGWRSALPTRRGGRRWTGRILFPGMGSFESGFQIPEIDLRIDGGGIELFMSKELLKQRQRRAVL